MKKKLDLPPEYKPFKRLRICGNDFENGRIPVASSTSAVFFVGEGESPSVWLTAPTGDSQDVRSFIVEKNIPRSSSISVSTAESSTVISFGNTTLIKVTALTRDSAEIYEIDLRPLGLKIYGDKEGLHVGKIFVKDNKFKNVDTMIMLENE